MSEYQIGKDVAQLELELRRTQELTEQIFLVLNHNLKIGKLEEPKEEKKK